MDGVPAIFWSESIRAWVTRLTVGADGLLAELLIALADKGESDTLRKVHEITVASWKGVRELQE